MRGGGGRGRDNGEDNERMQQRSHDVSGSLRPARVNCHTRRQVRAQVNMPMGGDGGRKKRWVSTASASQPWDRPVFYVLPIQDEIARFVDIYIAETQLHDLPNDQTSTFKQGTRREEGRKQAAAQDQLLILHLVALYVLDASTGSRVQGLHASTGL
eukprot:767188-Hanusia_phi.AAC.14